MKAKLLNDRQSVKKMWMMAAILGMCALLVGVFALDPGDSGKVHAAGTTYYVSPGGNDSNPGTELLPWLTLKKAASTLQSGDTAIFENGIYESTEAITFANNGTEGAPITVKAKNKHRAVLTFTGLANVSKIVANGKQYITIEGFEVTQPSKGTSTSDTFIDLIDCNYCTVIGTSIHHTKGRAVKSSRGSYLYILNNKLYDADQAAVNLVNTDRPVIVGNDIYDVSNGIMVPAGTRSAQIYNNFIHTDTVPMKNAIILGGNYLASAAYDPNGFEAYHAAAWNNIVVADTPGMIDNGLVFAGSTDSGFYHNVVVNTKYGVRYANGGGTSAGWEPVPTSTNVFNNIFSGCTMKAYGVTHTPSNPANDYNLYHNCTDAPTEANGVYSDPKFADPDFDWRLQADSPALEQATALTISGFYNEPIDLSLDYNGKPRFGTTHMGIYANPLPELGDTLLFDDFEGDASAWTAESGNLVIAEENPGNHVFTQPGASSSSDKARSYAGSMDWESYRYEAKVKLDQFYNSAGWITLYTRYLDINNYYLLEIQGSPDKGYIALKKKVDGTIVPLQEKIWWYPPLGEWIDIDFVVNGIEIEVYINGQLVLSGTDYELTHGSIAASIHQANISIDDVKVTEITNPVEGEPLEPDPNHEPGTFYVSPSGSDYNPGTEQSPWKTLAKAADTAQQGDTVIFEDGIYAETRPAIFLRSGTENERIVFKARNKHQAVIVYQNMPTTKIVIKSAYVTLQDFEITQNTRGIDTTDILVRMMFGGDHAQIRGNKIHNVYEDGVKAGAVTNPTIEGNIIYDIIHEGIDFVQVTQGVIRNNEVYDIGRCGIFEKGGSSDIRIHNNYIHNHNRFMFMGGIYLGGTTLASSSLDSSVNGYEAWNLVAYNNVIIGDVVNGNSTIDKGIDFEGSKDSAAYNNLIAGTNYGIYLEVPNNTSPIVGWDWNPDNVNPVFMNNIIMNTTKDAVKAPGPAPINLVHDYNLYYNNAIMPSETEPHGVYDDPRIANLDGGNWYLLPGSPAAGAGLAVPNFVLKNQQTIDISADYDGIARGTVWDQGIYRGVVFIDDVAPSWLTVSAITPTSVKLTWPSATDNLSVAGYRIYVDNVEYETVGSTVNELTVTDLTAHTSYQFKVTALDASDNESIFGLITPAKTLPTSE